MRDETEPRFWYLYLSSAGEDVDVPEFYGKLEGESFKVELPWLAKVLKPYTYQSNYQGRPLTHKLARAYGFSYRAGHLSIQYGRDEMDDWYSNFVRTRGWFIPWLNTRHVRHSLYYPDGKLFRNVTDNSYTEDEREVPKVYFLVKDYDGEELIAVCYRTEREWRHGTGWFKWLSRFRDPIIQHSLSINYSTEVGDEKGSYKGGTLGTSTEMNPGDTPIMAITRHCEVEGMTLLKPLPKAEALRFIDESGQGNWALNRLEGEGE